MSVITVPELTTYILVFFPKQEITPMKLQKLVYYVKAWTLVAGYPLITDDKGAGAAFIHWTHGPVNQELYEQFKHLGSKPIPKPDSTPPSLDDDDREIVNFIIENYIDYNAVELSIMTHNEQPWQETKPNGIISDKLIKRYYAQEPFARNFDNFDLENNRFYMLKDQAWHAFTMDMSIQDKELFTSFESYKEYVALKKDAKANFPIIQ